MLVASRIAPGKPEILHCLDVPVEERLRRHGRGIQSSIGELMVDQPTTVTFEFIIGEQEIVAGGRLWVVWRWPFDWSDLWVNLKTPDDIAELTALNSIRWRSVTAGNTTGILVRVHGSRTARLYFSSAPATFSIGLDDVCQAETTIDAGGIGRFVRLGPSADGPRSFEATWVETQIGVGVTPYWMRVVQVDQGMAWSSPVYVSRGGKRD